MKRGHEEAVDSNGYGNSNVSDYRPPQNNPASANFSVPINFQAPPLDSDDSIMQLQHEQQQQQLANLMMQGSLLTNNLISGSSNLWESNNPGGIRRRIHGQNFNKYQRIENQQEFGNGNAPPPNYQSQIPEAATAAEFNDPPNHILKCPHCGCRFTSFVKTVENQLQGLTSMAQSFENRVLQHITGLHQRNLWITERSEKERNERDENWRAAEIKRDQETAAARAAILSSLEKLMGEKITAAAGGGGTRGGRWPREEVDALIITRGRMESKFKEAGVKTSLWEEVSFEMEKLGFKRDAKRCKEKWENITKYYLKKKKDGNGNDDGKGVRKGCSYFEQLRKLYSSGEIDAERTLPPAGMVNNGDPALNNNNNGWEGDEDHQTQLYLESMLDLDDK